MPLIVTKLSKTENPERQAKATEDEICQVLELLHKKLTSLPPDELIPTLQLIAEPLGDSEVQEMATLATHAGLLVWSLRNLSILIARRNHPNN